MKMLSSVTLKFRPEASREAAGCMLVPCHTRRLECCRGRGNMNVGESDIARQSETSRKLNKKKLVKPKNYFPFSATCNTLTANFF